MVFQSVIGKIGNMRKVQDWTIYPKTEADQKHLTIQCDNRIARVDLETGKALLSSGKKGNNFAALSPVLGATLEDCPEEMLKTLREKAGFVPTGPIVVLGSTVIGQVEAV